MALRPPTKPIENLIKKTGDALLFAELYDLAFSWNVADELRSLNAIWERLLGSIPSDLCEMGAGTGRFSILLAQQGLRCTAVEPDPHMLTVLRWKQNSLPDIATYLKIIPDRFEQLNLGKQFDTIIAMTDTASYIWPLSRLEVAIKTAHTMLKEGGVLILDVGLWEDGNSETREETWTVKTRTGQVSAHCKAVLSEIGGQASISLNRARYEDLSFRYQSGALQTYASRETILHAFSFRSLQSLCERIGFIYALSLVPGTSAIREEGDTSRRALMALRKS